MRRRVLLVIVALAAVAALLSASAGQSRGEDGHAPPEWNLPYCPHPTAAENAASGYTSPDALEAAVANAPEYDTCQADPSMLTFDSNKQPVSAPNSAAGTGISEPANVSERLSSFAETRPTATVEALRFSYPTRFAHRYFASCAYMVTGVHGACIHGVFVASHRLPSAPERPGWQFLTREVTLELLRAPPQRYPHHAPIIASRYAFPLSLADFHSVSGGALRLGRGVRPVGEQLELFFRAAHANYWAIATISAGASRVDRSALASVIASIKPT